MPPLLCASPTILDQSFPRDNYVLYLVADVLGRIEELIQNDRIHLILTNVLQDLFIEFDWDSRRDQYAVLLDIHRLLTQWFLQPHERLIQLDISDVNNYIPHPLPEQTEKQKGLVELWSDEIGRLLVRHDQCCPHNQFFIGVACESAFSGNELGKYDNPDNQRTFPLVGPEEIDSLTDAYERILPCKGSPGSVSHKNAKRNILCLGGNLDRIRGDHFVYVFEGGRSWPLTLRDPVPEDHLQQLVSITGLSLQVVKYTLINGVLPEPTLRFDRLTR